MGKRTARPGRAVKLSLVKSIADRVAQHLENLRLLAQAERYRAEAEEAARRLTREGWESYLDISADASQWVRVRSGTGKTVER